VLARVTVYPRKEILDPQGKAICESLNRVGFETVAEVRAGKSFEVRLDETEASVAEETLRAMCEKLLANLVVEDYEIELVESVA